MTKGHEFTDQAYNYYKPDEAAWILGTDPRPTNWLNKGYEFADQHYKYYKPDPGSDWQMSCQQAKADRPSLLDYLPLGKTHRLYHGIMMAIALYVAWKVRKL